MSETFPSEVKISIFESQNGYCLDCLEPIHSYYHRLPNNKANRKKFPLFIHSPMNGAGLAFNCHTNKSHLYKITEKEAEVYEKYLQDIKDGKK